MFKKKPRIPIISLDVEGMQYQAKSKPPENMFQKIEPNNMIFMSLNDKETYIMFSWIFT
jgi:hypothetical protein